MRYDFWVIRYVPDAIRGEFVNVGVIAGSGEDWAFERVSNLRRASRLGGSATSAEPFLRRIEVAIDEKLSAVESLIPSPTGPLDRGAVEDLRVRMNNVVQLSSPRPVLAESAQDAARMAFQLMVVDTDYDVRHRSRTKVVNRLRKAFDGHPDLSSRVERFSKVAVGSQETGIDFAVTDGRVRQMSQVWAFDVKNLNSLQTQIQAWNYLLGLLRAEGAVLRPKGRQDGARVPSNVEINAVHTEPASAAAEAQLEIAQDGWRRLGVTIVPSSRSDAVVEEAERLLADSV